MLFTRRWPPWRQRIFRSDCIRPRYPERFAQQALGHNSKAVHHAYARHAEVTVPSLDDWEQSFRTGTSPGGKPAIGHPAAAVVAVDFQAANAVPCGTESKGVAAAGGQAGG